MISHRDEVLNLKLFCCSELLTLIIQLVLVLSIVGARVAKSNDITISGNIPTHKHVNMIRKIDATEEQPQSHLIMSADQTIIHFDMC